MGIWGGKFSTFLKKYTVVQNYRLCVFHIKSSVMIAKQLRVQKEHGQFYGLRSYPCLILSTIGVRFKMKVVFEDKLI